MRLVINTASIAHSMRRWLFKFLRTPHTIGRCRSCGKALSFAECTYYGTRCERCEGIDFRSYADLEREHMGDPGKETGIYAPGVPVGPPWCCEQGERLNAKMCPECDATSRAYSAAAGVAPTHVALPRELVSRAIEHLQSQATYTPSERNKDALVAVAGELLAHVSGADTSDKEQKNG